MSKIYLLNVGAKPPLPNLPVHRHTLETGAFNSHTLDEPRTNRTD